MRRLLALVVLLARPALAELPRVALEAPLTPATAAPAAAASSAVGFGASLVPALTPHFAAAPAASAVPAFSISAAPAAVAAAPSAAPVAALPAAAVTAAAQDANLSPSAFGANSENRPAASAAAPDSAPSLESAADELGRRFDGGAARPAPDLLNRLLQRVSIDARGVPEHGELLRRSLERMLESPTARALAERFIAEGPAAVVRFDALPGTQMIFEKGRTYFNGTRAFTDWTGSDVVVRVNDAYVNSSGQSLEQGLPAILAHELLGHGFWYARAHREGVLMVFHHHELNETNARLLGWLVDFELDQRFEEEQAWLYLQNPQAYLDSLKMRLPYYAKTFSNAEMLEPVATLEKRLTDAKAARARVQTERHNQQTWAAVVDHFIQAHRVPAKRFRNLNVEFAQADAAYAGELETLDALSKEVEALLQNFKAEPDGASEKVLKQVPSHPMFVELQSVTDQALGDLLAKVRASGAVPGAASAADMRAHEEYWRGQIDFAELQRMYFEDRRAHPQHWN